MVALGGVVVDDVEDHLDAGAVKRLDHPLEFAHLLAAPAGGGVLGVGREVPDRAVAPVVLQAALGQERLVGDVVDRQQLDRGDAEMMQVGDRGVRRKPGIRAAQILADVGMAHREALHVGLVDHGVGERNPRRTIALPEERVVDHHRLRHRGRVVLVIGLEVGVARSPVGTYGSTLASCDQSTTPSIAFA